MRKQCDNVVIGIEVCIAGLSIGISCIYVVFWRILQVQQFVYDRLLGTGKSAFERYVSESSFPEVVLTESMTERTQILQGYFETMMMRDRAEH